MRGGDSAEVSPDPTDRAHREIRAGILRGRFAVGSMLSEADLANDLGIGTTPILAALRRLQDEGWVTIYPKRGALVRELDPQETLDLAEARQVLEAAGVQRASDEDRHMLAAHLERIVEQQKRALNGGSIDSFAHLSLEFHRSFVEIGGNAVLLDFYDRMRDRQAMMIVRSRDAIAQRPGEIIAEHKALINLMRAGNLTQFAEVLRNHVLFTYGGLLGVI